VAFTQKQLTSAKAKVVMADKVSLLCDFLTIAPLFEARAWCGMVVKERGKQRADRFLFRFPRFLSLF
jgi:hypothetical protein